MERTGVGRLGACALPPRREETAMCRWLSYTGSPILLDELLYKPEHS